MEPPELGLSTWPVLWQVGRWALWWSSPGKVRGDPMGGTSPGSLGTHRPPSPGSMTQNCPLGIFPQLHRQGGMFWKGGRACGWNRPTDRVPVIKLPCSSCVSLGKDLGPFWSHQVCRQLVRAACWWEAAHVMRGSSHCGVQNAQVISGMDEARQRFGQGTSKPIASFFFYPDQP